MEMFDSCSPGNSQARMPQWVFYLMAVLFDAVTCIISTFYLVRSASGISRLVVFHSLTSEGRVLTPSSISIVCPQWSRCG